MSKKIEFINTHFFQLKKIKSIFFINIIQEKNLPWTLLLLYGFIYTNLTKQEYKNCNNY